MADKSTLWVWQQIYEPTQQNGKWVVHYRDPHTNQWKSEKFDQHEPAYNFYWEQTNTLKAYYNTFLKDAGMGK